MDKQIVVAVDLDDVCWDLVNNLLLMYNLCYSDKLTIDDITEWDIHKFLKPECDNIFEFADEGFFSRLKMSWQTVRALSELNNRYDLYFVSSGYPTTAPWRDKLLKKYLSWYDTKQLVLMADKSKFKCDYLIDDCYGNCLKGDYTGILMNRPWNKKEIYPDWLTALDLSEAVELIGRLEREKELKND